MWRMGGFEPLTRTVNPWLRDKRPTVAAQLPLSINSLGLLAQESNSNSFDEKGRQRH